MSVLDNGLTKKQSILEGAINFRDLGGYRTTDGRRIKKGSVYRSGSLSKLTEKDQTKIIQLGVKRVYDFRNTDEAEKDPDLLPESSSIEYIRLPVVHGVFDVAESKKKIENGDLSWLTDDLMIDGYKKNIDDFAGTWGAVLKRLSDPDGCPLVFHCNMGKDRTGTCAAVVLLALGASEETVIYDYEVSNFFLSDWIKMIKKEIRSMGLDPDKMTPVLIASHLYIVVLIEHIKKKYGDIDNYLINMAGVSEKELEDLRGGLLETRD